MTRINGEDVKSLTTYLEFKQNTGLLFRGVCTHVSVAMGIVGFQLDFLAYWYTYRKLVFPELKRLCDERQLPSWVRYKRRKAGVALWETPIKDTSTISSDELIRAIVVIKPSKGADEMTGPWD